MAKKPEAVSGSKGRIKIRYFEVDVDGDSEALQDGLRALSTALSRPMPGNGQRVIGAIAPAQLIEGSVPSDEPTDGDDAALESEEEVVKVKPTTRKVIKSKSAPVTPKVLDQIDFNSGSISWNEFAKAKAPSSGIEKVAAVATWFKRHRGLDQISIDHAYTAFKIVGWPTPDDIAQTFRNAKNNREWFKTPSPGAWEINIVGLNFVEDKMGRQTD